MARLNSEERLKVEERLAKGEAKQVGLITFGAGLNPDYCVKEAEERGEYVVVYEDHAECYR